MILEMVMFLLKRRLRLRRILFLCYLSAKKCSPKLGNSVCVAMRIGIETEISRWAEVSQRGNLLTSLAEHSMARAWPMPYTKLFILIN